MKKSELSDAVRLSHMRENAEKALEFAQGKTREALDEDEVLARALIHTLTIIGEAANSVSPTFRVEHPEIPWAAMIGMRHRIVHAYFDIDLDIVWDTVTKNIPVLLEKLDQSFPLDDSTP